MIRPSDNFKIRVASTINTNPVYTQLCVVCRLDLYLFHLLRKVKWFRYRPGVVQRVGRGRALLFHDSGTRRGWVVSSTPRPHFTSGKDPVPILQEAGWAPGPVWRGGKFRPHRDSIPDSPACNQPLYLLSYPTHLFYLLIYLKHKGEALPKNLKSELIFKHWIIYDCEFGSGYLKTPVTTWQYGMTPSRTLADHKLSYFVIQSGEEITYRKMF